MAVYNQAKVDFLLEKEQPKERQRSRKRKVAEDNPDVRYPKLVDLLKHWRMEEARERNVPAFHILTQKALIGVAAKMPRTKEALMEVSGIGQAKCSQFGDAIVEVVENFIRRQGIEVPKQAVVADAMGQEVRRNARSKAEKSPVWVESVRLFVEGKSMEEVAATRGLAPSTVASHLQQALEA